MALHLVSVLSHYSKLLYKSPHFILMTAPYVVLSPFYRCNWNESKTGSNVDIACECLKKKASGLNYYTSWDTLFPQPKWRCLKRSCFYTSVPVHTSISKDQHSTGWKPCCLISTCSPDWILTDKLQPQVLHY